MQALKYLLIVLFMAVFTSSWWAAGIWGYGEEMKRLWTIPISLTVMVIVWVGWYIMCGDWDKR
jgi:hypothetical protein